GPLLASALVASVVLAALAGWGWLRAHQASQRPVTWQYVNMGDSVTMVIDNPAMSLSPDGSMLVFRDSRQDGLLWLKRRGQLDPTSIPGTERALNPVFSPDGEWIAYVADGRLRKVRTSGGASVTLADSAVAGYGGGAWLDDGTIVYVSPDLNKLLRVSEARGASTVVLRGSLLGGGGIGIPVALPGARGVLFQYCLSGCVTMSIHILDLEAGTQKELLPDVAQAAYLPNGHLIYVRSDGAVMAAPFDLDRLEITGEAVPVLEDVQVVLLRGFAVLSWSQSGSLVYARRAGGGEDYAAIRVSREGTVTPIDTSWSGPFNSLALSPNGRRLAVGVGQGSGLNIWVKELDHGPSTRLSFGNQDRRPAWSPDGKMVAFIRDSANTSLVYGRPVDGSGPERPLARIDRQVQEVTWSPDGRWLVLRTDNTQRGVGDLVGVRVQGDSTPVTLVEGDYSELHPAVSPDGRWLAYTSNESGTNEVYVRPFPDTDGGRWQVSNGGGLSPVWSPTGNALYYVDGSSRMVSARVQADATFTVEGLTPLFNVSGVSGFSSSTNNLYHTSFAVTPTDSAFIFLAPRQLSGAGEGPRLVWVDNWFADLRRS
ncbi:MAG: hypothetical protein P8170_16020, partial [Gemmatimonadota bacterium]